MFENDGEVEGAAGHAEVVINPISAEPPITYHGNQIEIKDRHNRFKATSDFIWNNPYRATSNKIRGYWHAQEQQFKCN